MNSLRAVGFLFSMATLFLLSACGRTEWQIDRTRHKLEQIELQMSKAEVVAIMGSPHKREAFFDEGGEPIEVLLYETEYTYAGNVPDSAFTPILLRRGRVVGWGRNMYDRTLRYHIEQDIKVNHDRSVSQQP